MIESTRAQSRAWGHGAGFTIVELMITLAVASILMALAVPSFNQMIVSGRLTAQSNDMLASISLARSEAIKRNASVTLCRTSSSTSTDCSTSAGVWQNWIIRIGASGAGSIVRQGTVNSFGGTLVMRSSLTNDQVVFGADGLARTGGVERSFTVCSVRNINNNVRQIVFGAGSRMTTVLSNTTACT
jgi:type IV fimbrial biogenesis protein FimT